MISESLFPTVSSPGPGHTQGRTPQNTIVFGIDPPEFDPDTWAPELEEFGESCDLDEEAPDEEPLLAQGTYYVHRGLLSSSGKSRGSKRNPFSFGEFLTYVSAENYLPGVRFILDSGTWSYGSLSAASTKVLGASDPLIIIRASGSATWPLTIQGTYTSTSVSTSKDISVDNQTVIEGSSTTKATGTAGIMLEGCRHVDLEHLQVRGFKDGVRIFGRCRFIRCTFLQVAFCAVRGIFIRLGDDDNLLYVPDDPVNDGWSTPDDIGDEYPGDKYPACILIERCALHDNGCGCESGSTQLAIGSLATNVTVRCCEIYCSDPTRGSDGITFVACSSGHVIEFNDIHHIPRLQGLSCPEGCPPAENQDGTPKDDTSDGDGLDLKGVRNRTALSGLATVVRYNTIHHCEGTGITIQGGSVGVVVYSNEVFCNNTGIYLASGRLQAPYEDAQAAALGSWGTGFINLYRNLVYRQYQRDGKGGNGIELDLADGIKTYTDSSVFVPMNALLINIVHNTLDLNASFAVSLDRTAGTGPSASSFSAFNISSNILSRSNSSKSNLSRRVLQLAVSDNVDSLEVDSFKIDGNLYVFFDDDFADLAVSDSAVTVPSEAYIARLGATYAIVDLKTMQTLGFETNWQGRGDSVADPLNPSVSFSEVCVESAGETDYHLEADSPAIGTALASVGLKHFEVKADVANAPDFYLQGVVDEPDVGAVESEYETPARNQQAKGFIPSPPGGIVTFVNGPRPDRAVEGAG